MYQKLIEEFGKTVNAERVLLEAIAVGDEKETLAEAHFLPLPTHDRPIYSHTKSFTSTAVGLAVADGKLSLDDRPADLFPERVPKDRPELYQIKLRHLLTMSSGFDRFLLDGSSRRQGAGYPDNIAYLFSQPMYKTPGESFAYSNGDTHLAGRMVQRAVGQDIRNYLYERLFSKMEIGYPAWDADPEGYSFGATGLYLSVISSMKLGQLFLAGGKWKGEQLVDPAWVKEATAEQIPTGNNGWNDGYGYQWWRASLKGAYRADGAFGQTTTVIPERGLVVAVQCPESGNFDELHPQLTQFLAQL